MSEMDAHRGQLFLVLGDEGGVDLAVSEVLQIQWRRKTGGGGVSSVLASRTEDRRRLLPYLDVEDELVVLDGRRDSCGTTHGSDHPPRRTQGIFFSAPPEVDERINE